MLLLLCSFDLSALAASKPHFSWNISTPVSMEASFLLRLCSLWQSWHITSTLPGHSFSWKAAAAPAAMKTPERSVSPNTHPLLIKRLSVLAVLIFGLIALSLVCSWRRRWNGNEHGSCVRVFAELDDVESFGSQRSDLPAHAGVQL